jgi:hypothetical protein
MMTFFAADVILEAPSIFIDISVPVSFEIAICMHAIFFKEI